jgi:serine protease Do
LINAQGDVVGITTAVSREAMNIGFAIPITHVVSVLPQLREHGTVARGFIGTGLTSVTPELRRALGLGPAEGALVQDVKPETPAERAGLRAYDVVVAIDGEPVASDEQLVRQIASRPPGTVAVLHIWRDGATRRVPVKLSIRPEPTLRARPHPGDAQAAHAQAPLGLSIRDLSEMDVSRFRLPDSAQGVLVTDVDPAGPARVAQVQINHVILEINREPVRSATEYHAAVGRLKPGQAAALLIFDKSTRERAIYTVLSDSAP